VSAPALRAPARSWPVARRYLGLLARGRAWWAYLLTPCIAFLAAGSSRGFGELAFIVPFMSLLPPIQGGLAGNRGPLEHALPIGRVRDDLLWVGCGAAWAAVVLALAVALTTTRVAPYPGGYPLLLFATGMGYYLVGAAAWLAASETGSALVLFCMLASVPLVQQSERLAHLLALREAPSSGEALALAVAAALWLAVGAAAVALAATAPRRLPPGPAGWARRSLPRLPSRKPRELPAGALRRPPPLGLVLWREVVLQWKQMAWRVALTLYVVLWLTPAMGGQPAIVAQASAHGLFALTVGWPALVWVGERTRHGGAAPLPVGMTVQRLVRVAAGAVWMEVAVLAALAARAAGVGAWGSVGGSPEAVAGIAVCALVLYLLGSVGPLLLRVHRSEGGWMFAWFSFLLLALIFAMPGRTNRVLAPSSVLVAFFGPRPAPWLPAALLWGAVLAGLVWAAAAGGAARERGGPWSPAHAGRAA
jgi:hypothetical protein